MVQFIRWVAHGYPVIMYFHPVILLAADLSKYQTNSPSIGCTSAHGKREGDSLELNTSWKRKQGEMC